MTTTTIARTSTGTGLAKPGARSLPRLADGPDDTPTRTLRVAKGLGWFSLALGFSELLAPGPVARLIGGQDTKESRKLLSTFGAREIAAGLGILMGRRTTGWVWTRVLGDAVDLSVLGLIAAGASRRDRPRALGATAAVAGVTALDVLTAVQLTRNPPAGAAMGIDVKKAITVNRTPSEVYGYFRRFENLPRFMTHLESVTTNGRLSTWRACAPVGKTVEWQAEMTEDVPNEKISWRSLPGSMVPNHGSVHFRAAPGNRGTEVLVHLKYDVPGRSLARVFALLFGEEPSLQIHEDLRRFKQMMELGDVLDSDSSIHKGTHAARPPKTGERTLRGGNGKEMQP